MKRIPWLQFLAPPVATAVLLAATPAISAPCQGGADNEGTFILNLAKYSIDWNEKKPVCIHFTGNDKELTFNVRIAGPYHTENAPIEIREKVSGANHPTIRGKSSSGSRTFTVTVSEASNPSEDNKDYEFLVKVPNLGTLDPMVRIIR